MQSLKPSVWSGRRVLLTGHTGFKGAWLSMWLARLGAQVTGFSDGVPTSPSLFESADVAGDVASVTGNVRDLGALTSTVADSGASVVFHLAAQPLVRPSYEDPVGTFLTNVMGTVNLLEAVRQASSTVDAVVVVTTDKCYENRGWEYGYRESDHLGGRDPYSASKAAAEFVAKAYREALLADDGPAVVTVRAGNVIGGGDWARDRLLPDIVRAASSGDRRVVLRNPTAERPWQHVLDCLAGYLLLTERLLVDRSLAGAWNFGPAVGAGAQVRQVVEAFIAGLDVPMEVEIDRDRSGKEELLLALDASRAQRLLGWSPRLGLDESLDWAASWYASYARGEEARELTLEQIARFEELH